MTRRAALRTMATLAAGAVVGGCQPSAEPAPVAVTPSREPSMNALPGSQPTMPTVFLPHGGGPWPFIENIFGAPDMWDRMRAYMENLDMVAPERPRAVLCVSAHWEAPVPTVQTSASPPMLYDYYGFPEESYEVQWPAPGAPEVAGRVRDLLEGAGYATAEDNARGFDHGVFVPLKLAYPQAQVPTFQLSLVEGLDPATHFALGRALSPLRQEGVFIVGSGMSYHNLQALMRRHERMGDDSRAFDDWLAETADLGASEREQRLIEWEAAPRARACHPREEHLLPLHVIAGAAAEDAAHLPYRDEVMGARVSALHFG